MHGLIRLIAAGIAFYRRFLRPLYRRECLFRISCSEHVLRASRQGWREAWRAFTDRCQTCRADFGVGQRDGELYAIAQNGRWIASDELIDAIQDELAQVAHSIRCTP